MERSELTLAELYPLIPDVEELEGLRLSIIGAAVPDPGRAWAKSSAYLTVDQRIISGERLEQAVNEAEEALHAYVTSLFSTFRPLFRTFRSGREIEAAYQLVEMGEQQESFGRYQKARRCFEAALAVSLPLVDKGPQILALRRIARVARALGDLREALDYYRRSAELARDAQDLHGSVIARTGYANVLSVQGRWAEAEQCYRVALAELEGSAQGDSLRLEEAQLCNNLAMVATRQDQFAAAEQWLERAFRLWAEISSPVDLAVCYYNQGFLRERQGRMEEARASYEQALSLDIPASVRAGVAVQLADLHLQEGQLAEAERRGREAEQHAITAQSPYYLAEMYRALGNVARAKGDHDGLTFYEKALELARQKEYPLLEARILLDYALLRQEMGEREEAVSYLERAREIFSELEAVHEQARAEQALWEIETLANLRAAAD